MTLQQNLEVLQDKDLARLKTNDSRLANRFAEVNGKKYPILHLSIADVEIFRVLTERLDSLFLALANGYFFDYIEENSTNLIDFLQHDIPEAASIVLRISVKKCKRVDPLTLLKVVMRQWVHNLEIDKIQSYFPMPEDDEPDVDIGAPTNNPMSLDERLCSNYHWTLKEAQKITYPQAYLLSNESAWSYEKAKAKGESDSPKPTKKMEAPKKAGAKRFIERFGDTPAEQLAGYKAYMEEMGFGGREVIRGK